MSSIAAVSDATLSPMYSKRLDRRTSLAGICAALHRRASPYSFNEGNRWMA
jgi:hypothetical protein